MKWNHFEREIAQDPYGALRHVAKLKRMTITKITFWPESATETGCALARARGWLEFDPQTGWAVTPQGEAEIQKQGWF